MNKLIILLIVCGELESVATRLKADKQCAILAVVFAKRALIYPETNDISKKS